jgi:microcystin-dependent protein
MDSLQTCYVSDMRLYPDHPEIITRGRWRWCPEGAEPLPFAHRFCSQFGDNWTDDQDPPIGELKGLKGRANGYSDPRYTGKNFCGAQTLWQHGSPLELRGTPAVDADGVPVCCATAGPELGGLAVAGDGQGSSWTDIALWLRPDELAGLSGGAAIATWPAAPFTPRDGTSTGNVPVAYHVDSVTGRGGGLFLTADPPVQQSVIGFAPLNAVGDYTVYVVGRTLLTSANGPAVFSSGGDVLVSVSPLGVATQWHGLNQAHGGAAPILGSLHIWSGRRKGPRWEVWRDGLLVASLAFGLSATVNGVDSLAANLNPGAGGLCWIPEVRAWTRALSAGEDAANWQYLAAKYGDPSMPPTGSIQWMAAATPMEGYLLCDGAAYLESDHPELASYLGGAYDTFRGQAAPPAGQFRVPMLNGLVPVAAGPAAALPTTSNRVATESGGEETHQLLTAELASHGHTVNDPGHFHGPGANQAAYNGTTTLAPSFTLAFGTDRTIKIATNTGTKVTGVTVNGAGGDVPHNTLQPYAVLFAFVKT